ncbi:hypothetical protein [Nonomuraea sp. NPDC049684]|uniref:hypothetical protein n=1 Tax=Nonomuraea sp. NPDC049684 TaxID=3364356 RepID=UPI0037A2A350
MRLTWSPSPRRNAMSRARAGVAVGVLTGALCVWGLGLLAERRLRAQGPELLDLMRTGRRQRPAVASRFDRLSTTQRMITWWCFGLGAIPLVPQGVLAAVFVSKDMLRHSCFLATYMPPGPLDDQVQAVPVVLTPPTANRYLLANR